MAGNKGQKSKRSACPVLLFAFADLESRLAQYMYYVK